MLLHSRTKLSWSIGLLFILFGWSQSLSAQCHANAGGDVTICVGQSITIGGTPSAWGGDGNYTYDWDVLSGANDIANPIISPTSTTTYLLTVIDGTGCEAQDIIIVTVNPLPTVNAGPDLDPCLNDPAITLPSGGTWSGAPGTMLSGTGVFTPNTVGTYNLVLSNTVNGCTATDTKVVQVRALPTVNAGPDQTICAGQTVQLSATASSPNGPIIIYTWSGGGPGNGVSNSLSQTPTATPSTSVTYSVTAADSEQCYKSDQISVIVNPLPSVDAGLNLTVCTDPYPFTLTGQTPAGGTWSGSTYVTSAGAFTPSVAGTYTLTYSFTNSNNCTRTDTRTITVVAPGNVNAGSDVELCQGSGSYTLQPITSGGSWSGSSYVTSAGVFTPTAVGTYVLNYTVNMGTCNAYDQITVTVRSLPSVSAGADISYCAGSSAVINGVSNASNLSWSPTTALSSSTTGTPTVSATSTTVYTLTATDNFGCSSTDQVTVTVNNPTAVDAGNNLTLCQSNNAITLSGQTPAGGTWSGSALVTSAGIFTPSITGTYTLTYTYTNAQGCSSNDTRSVTVSAPLTVDAGPNHSVCIGSSAFTLQPITTGGTWSGSSMVSSAGLVNPSSTGVHTLTYTVDNGVCTATDQITLTVHSLPTVNAGGDIALCTGQSATVLASATGNGLSYSWSPATNLNSSTILQPIITPVNTGIYTLTVQDNNGCQNSDAIAVTVSPLPIVEAGNDLTLCTGSSATLTGQTPVGGAWSGTGVTSGGVFTASAAGTFVLTYSFSNGNGCVQTDTRTITVLSAPVISAGSDQTVCVNSASLLLSANTSDTGLWTGNGIVDAVSGEFDPASAGVGIHTITLTNNSGVCSATDVVIVTVNALPTIAVPSSFSACQENGLVTISPFSPTGGIWSGSGIVNAATGTIDPDAVASGVYSLGYSFTDATSGCVSNAQTTLTIHAKPQASFTALPTVCIGQDISLNNGTSGATTYAWTFGDSNSIVNSASPSKSYAFPGTYTITLIATGAGGCTDTATATVQVIGSPVAGLTASVNSGCAPLMVSFTNTSQAANATFEWLVDGNAFSGAALANQLFEENPSLQHQVVLTATNSCGVHSASTTINVLPRPNAEFNSHFTSTICSPATVEFSNSSSGNPDTYHWLLGNGNESFSVNPNTTIYTANGTATSYDICLVAINECGVDSMHHTVTVQPNMVEAAFGLTESAGCAPFSTQIVNASVGATSYSYYVPGLGTYTVAEPSLYFSTPGDYEVYQYATDGCGFDTTMTVLSALATPTVDFTTNSDLYCENTDIHFSAVSSGASSFSWEMGDEDDTIMLGQTIVYAYEEHDDYAVTLTGTANNNCSASITKQVNVFSTPVAHFSLSDYIACSPLDACSSNQSTGADYYQWNVSNGNTAEGETPCFQLWNNTSSNITETIEMRAYNAHGCYSLFTQDVEINSLPVASFDLPDFASCTDSTQTIPVNNSPDGLIYGWYVDGVLVASNPDPHLPVQGEGAHSITLTTTSDQGCSNSQTRTFTIYPLPEVSFSVDANEGCVGEQFQFTNTSNTTNFSYWNFGDGDLSDETNPRHIYDEQGVFDVSLTVTSEHGCTNTIEMPNIIETFPQPEADFDLTPTETSIYLPTVEFTDQSLGADAYYWNFGDGNTSGIANPVHNYTAPGVWNITLTIYNQWGCSSMAQKSVNITNEFQVFIPTAFTPDGDGLNDAFKPVMAGKSFIRKYDFVVVDKWGAPIFKTDNPDEAWYGNVNGGDHYVEPGIYNYRVILEFDDNAETQVLAGTVVMIR